MKLYLNELAPWERKREYYQHIQLGKDVRSQTEAIKNQTKAMIVSQLATTHALIEGQKASTTSIIKSQARIVTSQERISEGIDALSYNIERVEEGIYGLKAAFEWGISEVIWQIEQNRNILKNILEVLQAPLETQGKELRKRAEEAYANGWMDEALEDFLESEKKNRYDFSIHISLGMIYLFHKINKEKALEYFEKAAKYSKPKSNYHTCFSLLHLALIKRDMGHLEEAEKYSHEAVNVCPDFSEAIYQNALYNSLLNNSSKAIPSLERVINIDSNYCEKIVIEEAFDNIRNDITELFKKLRDSESLKVNSQYDLLLEKFSKICRIIKDMIDDNRELNNSLKNIDEKLQRVYLLKNRHSYRDYLEANAILSTTSKDIENYHLLVKEQIVRIINSFKTDFSNTESSLESKIQSLKNRIDKINRRAEQIKNKLADILKTLILFFGIPLSILFGLRGCMKTSDNNGSLVEAIGSFLGILIIGAGIMLILYVLVTLFVKKIFSKRSENIYNLESQIEQLKGELTNKRQYYTAYIDKFNSLSNNLMSIK